MGYTTLVTDPGNSMHHTSFKISYDGKITFVSLSRERKIGRNHVESLMERMVTEGAESGMIITTGLFTKNAIRFAISCQIELVDGFSLLSLFSCHRSSWEDKWNISDTLYSFPLPSKDDLLMKEISPKCPKCGSGMRIRVYSSLRKPPVTFWKCSRHPACDAVMDYELCAGF
jgi:restriction system protein